MMNTVFTKIFEEPEFNIKEILRYSGCKEPTEDVLCVLDECIEECKKELVYRVCYCETCVNVGEGCVDFPFAKVKSTALAKNLSGCKTVILFAATVGIGIDRLIAKYGKVSQTKAVFFQAIGAERIESLCDTFEKEQMDFKAAEKKFLRPRFSPGYGDFELGVQSDIFRVLDCPRRIGLSLNKSLLMSPSKSVTAIIGVSDKQEVCASGCDLCNKKDCAFKERI